MSNVWLPPKFIIYPSKLPPAVACVKMTRHQFEGWKWVRGTQAAAAKLYYYFLEMGSSLILLITAEAKRNQNMLPNQHKGQVTEAWWHVWYAAFIKFKISGAWEMMILTHYECQCCRRWLVVVPSPTLTFLQNMQLYIPMGICMLMFRYCRINCYHQPQPGPVVRRCSRFVSSDVKPQPFF